jgi:hypothetical protein
MLFCQQSLLQLRAHSYFPSHTLMGSIYLCYVKFSLVASSNGIMANDWWCRDETESLLWCTHGSAARHALVSQLIVLIHCETTMMCYLLWIFSQSDRCILSQYVAMFYPNLSSVYCQIPSHEFHLSPAWELHASPPLKILIRISGRDSFKGGRLWHPRCQFRVCREIYPNLGCSVKISISCSRMSLTIQLIPSHFTEFGIIQSHRRPNLEPVKTFISRNKCKLDNHSQFIKLD